MKRYNIPNGVMTSEHKHGVFTTYADTKEVVELAMDKTKAAFVFALAHQDDIDNDVADYGLLKDILEIARAAVEAQGETEH